jgi:16S rRNA G966 N2-methylase RsmD
MANSFQIIGGEHRSRKFIFADAEGLRPTPSKVRETLWHCPSRQFLPIYLRQGLYSK